MATKPTIQVATQLSGPQHYMPPTTRDLRAQAVQRLQGGLFGLAAMLLLVGLANIIMDRARLAETPNGVIKSAGSPTAPSSPPGDPLADIGEVGPSKAVATTRTVNGQVPR